MPISQLHIEQFRNLANQVIPFSPSMNLITGDNGAGKTALLEAIYFLGRQRSFRTAKLKELIQTDTSYFRLIAKTQSPTHQIGLERRIAEDRKLSSQLRIDRQAQQSPAQLIKMLPTIAITARSFRLIDAGPAYRRQFMDYGAFQLNAPFFSEWQTYEKALKSRNAALKKHMARAVIDSFTPALVAAGEQVHSFRTTYFKTFQPLLTHHLRELEFPYIVDISYFSGWARDESLSDCLQKHIAHDDRLGHTRYGPHRADMRFSVADGNAENRLSRGQQKTLILAMYLAQIDLISQHAQMTPLLIFDDIAAELDAKRRNLVLRYVSQLDCQLFFSATEASLFDDLLQRSANLIQLSNGNIVTS